MQVLIILCNNRKVRKNNGMKIKFFEKDGHINPEAIYAGIYQFKIGLLNESNPFTIMLNAVITSDVVFKTSSFK